MFNEDTFQQFKDLTVIFTSPNELTILVVSSVDFIPIVHSVETERELIDAHRRLHCIKGSYGSGYQNAKYARGTLVWDSREGEFSVKVLSSAASLTVVNRHQYWAQSGISMGLNNESGWAAQADKENMPNRTGSTQRAGLVYNTS
ncbi:hypothetical protein D3C74_378050 [compost metagenome]